MIGLIRFPPSNANFKGSRNSDSEYNSNSANWSQKTVSLNSYRTTDSTFYIYFVALL